MAACYQLNQLWRVIFTVQLQQYFIEHLNEPIHFLNFAQITRRFSQHLLAKVWPMHFHIPNLHLISIVRQHLFAIVKLSFIKLTPANEMHNLYFVIFG